MPGSAPTTADSVPPSVGSAVPADRQSPTDASASRSDCPSVPGARRQDDRQAHRERAEGGFNGSEGSMALSNRTIVPTIRLVGSPSRFLDRRGDDPWRPVTGRTGRIGSWVRTRGTKATNGTKGSVRTFLPPVPFVPLVPPVQRHDPPRPVTGRTGRIGSWMRTRGTKATNGTKGTARTSLTPSRPFRPSRPSRPAS